MCMRKQTRSTLFSSENLCVNSNDNDEQGNRKYLFKYKYFFKYFGHFTKKNIFVNISLFLSVLKNILVQFNFSVSIISSVFFKIQCIASCIIRTHFLCTMFWLSNRFLNQVSFAKHNNTQKHADESYSKVRQQCWCLFTLYCLPYAEYERK